MTIHAGARVTRSTWLPRSTGWPPFALVAPVVVPATAGSLPAWMAPVYAPALGAGTQVFTHGVGQAIFGTSEVATDLSTAEVGF
jgi:hypothetical protein